jgi:hypothetical protein
MNHKDKDNYAENSYGSRQANKILPSQQVEQHTQWGVDPGEELQTKNQRFEHSNDGSHRTRHDEGGRPNRKGLPGDSTDTFTHLNLDQHDIEVQKNEDNNEVSPQITNRHNLRDQLQFPGHGKNRTHNIGGSPNNHRSTLIDSLDEELEEYMNYRGKHDTRRSTSATGGKSPIRFPTPEPIGSHTNHQVRYRKTYSPIQSIQQWRTDDNLDCEPLKKNKTTVTELLTRQEQKKHITTKKTHKQGSPSCSSYTSTQ